MIENLSQLPAPASEVGYGWTQLEAAMDAQQLARLELWLRGQTVGLDQGETVVYPWDLERFLDARPIID